MGQRETRLADLGHENPMRAGRQHVQRPVAGRVEAQPLVSAQDHRHAIRGVAMRLDDQVGVAQGDGKSALGHRQKIG